MSEMTLSKLKTGERGEILKVGGEGELRGRLASLGFRKGAVVAALYSAPLGGPKTYLICGSQVSLRKSEADYITINCRAEE